MKVSGEMTLFVPVEEWTLTVPPPPPVEDGTGVADLEPDPTDSSGTPAELSTSSPESEESRVWRPLT